ncbi:TolC family protein [Granulicella sp. L60]|uniref:TolC family protein n=1 Tax=Granulicella sp. L60 TaxID=1641866 RepID=UPI00131E6D8B|nr:TolC family protein [Granulicella sp. L60]
MAVTNSGALALLLSTTSVCAIAQQLASPALNTPQPGTQQTQPAPLPPPTPQEQKEQQNLPAVGPLSAAQARAAAEKVDTVLPDMPVPPAINAQQDPAPTVDSTEIQSTARSKSEPARDQVTGMRPNFLGFLGPYRRPHVPELFPGSGERLQPLVRDGKLYLSLHDALALVIENNLEVEVERYNLQLAETDIVRASGGGSTRGIDYNITESPQGIGGPGSPLLNSSQTSTNPIAPTIDDLTSLNSTTVTQNNLSQTGTQTYSAGANIPYFDPTLIAEAGYFRRSDIVTIGDTTGTGLSSTGGDGSTSAGSTPDSLHYITANIAYIEGFSTGTQIEGTVNNDSQVIYSSNSQNNPFSSPSTSVTITQPLLRGFGRGVNLRYLRIANLNRQVSHLLFRQQLIDTIYGTSRLYYDLVSLGENIAVKQEALRAARKLYDDDNDQVKQGTLAPIELTRAQALLTSSEFDLVQAQGLYRQQEVILRNEIIRPGAPAFHIAFSGIIPTDRITVPENPEELNVEQLEAAGLANRPDLAQAHLQVKSGEISVQGSRNNALTQLNVYANVQTRGSSEQNYEPLGSPAAAGTGAVTIPQNLALGGLRTATIYQAGVQVTLPLRNRIAQADAARDTIQLRQSAARTERLEDQIREEIENAVIALQTAQAAYNAAVASRGYQQQLLDAERDKLAFGQSTNLLVVQNEAYLAQARSTEIAARSNWMKARIALDRALGNLLEKNNISLDDAINGRAD